MSTINKNESTSVKIMTKFRFFTQSMCIPTNVLSLAD